MKRLFLIMLMFTFIYNVKSQELSAVQLIDNIMEVQSMRELNKFRDDLVKEMKTLDMSNITPEEHQELGMVYEKMRTEYNSLIGLIKQDILDFKNIKLMSKNSSEVSARYKTTINNVTSIYNNEFLPTYASLSQDRNLIALIFPLIEKGIRFIIDIIKTKKLKKETLMNDLLNITNVRFNDGLVLPPWNTLTKVGNLKNSKLIGQPEITINSVETPIVVQSKIKPVQVDTTVSIEYPSMKQLSGSIQFISYEEDGSKYNMEFEIPKTTRDLKVGIKNSSSFISKLIYEVGLSFQIRITNTAFVYVFAFNDNDVCYPIYPYNNDWVQSFNMTKDRNLGVGPLMMKDNNNLLVIPSKNADTGEENYIQIAGASDRERLCLILSKSELDLNDLCKKIESMTGSLSSRVNSVLSSPNLGTLDNLKLTIDSEKINFEMVDKWLIPLIFEIRRN